jgi:preprotein translocase subunit SecG
LDLIKRVITHSKIRRFQCNTQPSLLFFIQDTKARNPLHGQQKQLKYEKKQLFDFCLMRLFILLFYLVLTVFMSAVILFQKGESSLGLGSGTMGGMMTARGTANLLTRLTAVLATLFFALNIWLAYLGKVESSRGRVQEIPQQSQTKTKHSS